MKGIFCEKMINPFIFDRRLSFTLGHRDWDLSWSSWGKDTNRVCKLYTEETHLRGLLEGTVVDRNGPAPSVVFNERHRDL